MIEDISNRLLREFATCLQTRARATSADARADARGRATAGDGREAVEPPTRSRAASPPQAAAPSVKRRHRLVLLAVLREPDQAGLSPR